MLPYAFVRIPDFARMTNTSTYHDASICSLIRSEELRFNSPLHMPIESLHPLEALMRQRIVVLDGAMGTMVQQHKLTESDYRGARFKDWKGKDLKGSIELLLLTKPAVIDEIHTGGISKPARTSSRPTLLVPRRSGCTISSFAANRKADAKDPEFFQRCRG